MNIKVLGSGQDAGIPQAGCLCFHCNAARADPAFRRLGPSIAIFDAEGNHCHLIDASPDIKYQLDMVLAEISAGVSESGIPVSGIFLTHTHYGHISGLLQLGSEVMDTRKVPVHCSPGTAAFLKDNHPFRSLVDNENIVISQIQPGDVNKYNDITMSSFQVPHRNGEDCVGYSLASDESGKVLVYIPDVDHWTDEIIERIGSADMALLDGTFYSRDEISRYEDVPHPPVGETMTVMGDLDCTIYFTHVNHTNPINMEGGRRKHVLDMGFEIAFDGLTLEL